VIAIFLCGCTQPTSYRSHTIVPTSPTVTILGTSQTLSPTNLTITTQTVDSAYWIKINPVSDVYIGDVFTISATTNLPEGTKVFFQTYRTSIKCKKYECTPNCLVEGPARVNEGEKGINTISIEVNSSSFQTDEFAITFTDENAQVKSTRYYNVLASQNATTM